MWYLMSVMRGSFIFFLSGRLAMLGVLLNARAWEPRREVPLRALGREAVAVEEVRDRERKDERSGERRDRIGVCVGGILWLSLVDELWRRKMRRGEVDELHVWIFWGVLWIST